MSNILVVPTIRKSCISNFFQSWNRGMASDWDEVIVIEDNPERTFEIPWTRNHFSWKEIDEELGHLKDMISRRDSAIRSFGFFKAYEMGAEYIFTLDDDCYPLPWEKENYSFCKNHIANMQLPRWTELIPGKRTRGLPYFNKGQCTNVVANIGLWYGVPDLDAVETLSRGIPDTYSPPPGNRIIPIGQYVPWTGMNCAFKREIAVLTYFPLMGQGQPYGRFDDIWFGIVCKRILDHLGLLVTVGEPWVYHQRASDPMKNLVKEAPGIQANETYWQLIDGIKLTASTPAACLSEIAMFLRDCQPDAYFQKLGSCMLDWITLFIKNH